MGHTEKYFKRVDMSGDCWLWTGPLTTTGYGKVSGIVKGKSIPSNRAAWIIAYGEVPPNLCVCHHCDNRRCVRPSHLFLGSQLDNIADRHAKGRTASGVNSGYGKQTHCKKGHAFTFDNTFIRQDKINGQPYTRRRCKICARAAVRANYWKAKGGGLSLAC